MVIALTGSRGFIGSRMKEYLLSLGHEVFEVQGDIKECKLPVVEGMMHFAANMGGVGYFSQKQFSPIIDNALMDMRVIDHCQKHNIRLLYPSSACCYPTYEMEKGTPLSEKLLTLPHQPDQMYGFEKLFITLLTGFSSFDLRTVILHTIYGEGQEFTGQKAKFPPQICHKFATQDQIEVWGTGEQTRTFLYISDALKMMAEVFFAPEYLGPVNISHEREVSVKEIVSILSKHTGKTNIVFDSTKPTGPLRRAVDMSLFNRHYTTRPEVSIEEGFITLYENIKHQTTRS